MYKSFLIGFIGAPSCGKTMTALGLSFRMKKEGYAVEFVPEAARQKIIECRVAGKEGNGGLEGQKLIYATDDYLHTLYRDHSQAITITDGSTINCYFYGLETLDLEQEAQKYQLLFYIPLHATAYQAGDSNRIQNHEQILSMGQRWDNIIPDLQNKYNHIKTLNGYPYATPDQMIDDCFAVITDHVQQMKNAA